MFDQLAALIALADHGTMGRAAVHLHITQSAVSKRIALLEQQLNQRLLEPRGRKVELTPAALRIVAGARPLISDLRDFLRGGQTEAEGTLVVDLSVSVLISWGAEALAKTTHQLPGLKLKVNAHHASVAVERVRSGESMLAIVQGESTIAPDLCALPLYRERIVVIPAGLKRLSFPHRGGTLEVMTIEAHTEAWRFMKMDLGQTQEDLGVQIKVIAELQSFSAITQLARAGFGHGLAPLGVARALGIPRNKLLTPPGRSITIPISLIGRRSTLARPLVQSFYSALKKYAHDQK